MKTKKKTQLTTWKLSVHLAFEMHYSALKNIVVSISEGYISGNNDRKLLQIWNYKQHNQVKSTKKRLKLVSDLNHSLKNFSVSKSHSLNAACIQIISRSPTISSHRNFTHFRFQVQTPFEQIVLAVKNRQENQHTSSNHKKAHFYINFFKVHSRANKH